MCLDFENLDELELMTKWVEDNPSDKDFNYKLKENAPKKFQDLFEKVRERFIKKN